MTRRRIQISLLLAVSQLVSSALAHAQQPAAPAQSPQPAAAASPQAGPAPQAGGTIHGAVKSGTIPLPGVSITATNTLTGKKYSTATDALGNYSMVIPPPGPYALRPDPTPS